MKHAKVMMMKISKSKRQLAQLLIEVGVTKFPDGANWAAQDRSGKEIYCYKNKPRRPLSWRSWHHDGGVVSNGEFQANALIANWHQTVLSSDEFDQIVAEIVADAVPDADGWIEWSGGECPVCIDDVVDVMQLDGHTYTARAVNFHWLLKSGSVSVAAYRLHKPDAKPEFCESVMRSIPEPTAKPTIEQLAADYRNKLDYANRKQDEADKANMDSDAALSELEAAIASIGFAITPLGSSKQDPELVITDWRDLRVGDEIEVFNFECPGRESSRKQELMSGPCVVIQAEGGNVRIELKKNLPTNGPHWNATGFDACDFKLIRRP